VVKLVGVAKSFGPTSIFKDVTFSVGSGELVEITGPSGAGKTTLLRLLHGQMRPNAGQVWVQGRGLHRWWRQGLGRARRDVSFIFQEQRLLPRLNAFENIILALQVRKPQLPYRTIKERALAALESVNLAGRRRAYPHQLSAGEKQRVAIARALVTRPRLLLADEPLHALDNANAELVIKLLEGLAASGTTVIVATHHHTFHSSRILRLPIAKVMVSRKAAGASGGSQVIGTGNGYSNGQANSIGAHPRQPFWRRLLPTRDHTRKTGVKPARLPLWRSSTAVVANTYRLVLIGGLRSWSRDVRQTAPALGTIALLLMLCGTLALVGIAVQGVVAQQAGQASLVRVYLASGASPDAVSALKTRLTSDSRVASVKNVSPEQALAEAASRPGLDNLASLSSTNPFPASLDVRVRQVTDVAAVAKAVKGDPAVDPAYTTSYDPDTYSRLQRFAVIAGAVGGGILLLFAIVAYAVIANSMRGIAAARRQEVAITRLLGARGWMLRGPFVVEGLMTGALAGALAAALVAGAWLLAVQFEAALYAQLLPGVGTVAVQYVLAAVITAGLILGAATAMFGFRRTHA
jgi:cell division transport system ATP-binding protein